MSERLSTGLQTVALADLRESEDNPRQISDERYEALMYSLDKDSEMMGARPLIATPDGEVVCGNMRHRAMVELGWTETKAFVADLDERRRREWMLRDNQEYGDWVPEELAAMVRLHADEEGDLKLLGMTEEKMDNLLKIADDENGSADNTHAPEPEVWGVIVECASEEQQAELLEELAERGLEVRSILS